VGGLLSVILPGETPVETFAVYDANGNVTEYVNASGATVAHYEYDPFGGISRQTGALADEFPHRFSTKYLDSETGLVYYGYRYYSPELGRWLSRDPLADHASLPGREGRQRLLAMLKRLSASYVEVATNETVPLGLRLAAVAKIVQTGARMTQVLSGAPAMHFGLDGRSPSMSLAMHDAVYPHVTLAFGNAAVFLVDPLGLKWRFANEEDKKLYDQAREYLGDTSAGKALDEVMDHPKEIPLRIARTERTSAREVNGVPVEVPWNPEMAIYYAPQQNGISPALALGHEAGHVAKALNDSAVFRRLRKMPCPEFDDMEEARNFRMVEKPSAETLGEAVRSGHHLVPGMVELRRVKSVVEKPSQ
jgi:RHS repeat-associated protein